MRTFLITGGAGFVGSHIAIGIKRDHEGVRVIALDNLRRRGAELNLNRLKACGVEYVHGDVRVAEDLRVAEQINCVIECSAEPSVLAGYGSSPVYVVNANVVGLVNCLELARLHRADVIFLSTSRVYPYTAVNDLAMRETDTRYEILDGQRVPGVSSAGLSEDFPMGGARSLYGATKLAGELIMQEYLEMYRLRGIVNRCGVLAGPWQMGKVDQGVITLWVARHIFGTPLSYIGFGGFGKQVRDILHVEDLYRLIICELEHMDRLNGQIFNVGGGRERSISLLELTNLCVEATGKRVEVRSVPDTRPADVKVYLSDCRRVREHTGWVPKYYPGEIVDEIATWIYSHRAQLENILE